MKYVFLVFLFILQNGIKAQSEKNKIIDFSREELILQKKQVVLDFEARNLFASVFPTIPIGRMSIAKFTHKFVKALNKQDRVILGKNLFLTSRYKQLIKFVKKDDLPVLIALKALAQIKMVTYKGYSVVNKKLVAVHPLTGVVGAKLSKKEKDGFIAKATLSIEKVLGDPTGFKDPIVYYAAYTIKKLIADVKAKKRFGDLFLEKSCDKWYYSFKSKVLADLKEVGSINLHLEQYVFFHIAFKEQLKKIFPVLLGINSDEDNRFEFNFNGTFTFSDYLNNELNKNKVDEDLIKLMKSKKHLALSRISGSPYKRELKIKEFFHSIYSLDESKPNKMTNFEISNLIFKAKKKKLSVGTSKENQWHEKIRKILYNPKNIVYSFACTKVNGKHFYNIEYLELFKTKAHYVLFKKVFTK